MKASKSQYRPKDTFVLQINNLLFAYKHIVFNDILHLFITRFIFHERFSQQNVRKPKSENSLIFFQEQHLC